MTGESITAAASCGFIGAVLFGYGLHLRSKLRACQSWPQIPGTITKSVLTTIEGYELSVTYEYTVSGASYSSSRVQFGSSGSYTRKSAAEKALSRYPVDSQVTVCYDPENPAEAVLDRTKPDGFEYILSGTIMLLMMLLVLLYPIHNPS